MQIPASLLDWRQEKTGWAYEVLPNDFVLRRANANAEGNEQMALGWKPGKGFSLFQSGQTKTTRSFKEKPEFVEETVVFTLNRGVPRTDRQSIRYRLSTAAELADDKKE